MGKANLLLPSFEERKKESHAYHLVRKEEETFLKLLHSFFGRKKTARMLIIAFNPEGEENKKKRKDGIIIDPSHAFDERGGEKRGERKERITGILPNREQWKRIVSP